MEERLLEEPESVMDKYLGNMSLPNSVLTNLRKDHTFLSDLDVIFMTALLFYGGAKIGPSRKIF